MGAIKEFFVFLTGANKVSKEAGIDASGVIGIIFIIGILFFLVIGFLKLQDHFKKDDK